MSAGPNRGRWVILLDDEDYPVFWSESRDALEHMCDVMKRTNPSARIVWQSAHEPAPLRKSTEATSSS